MAESVLDVHLAEYNSLRTEVLNRVQIQFSATNWLLTLLAATFAAVTFAYEKAGIRDWHWLVLQASVFLPLAAAPLAFMTFDHMIMIHRIGAYLEGHLRPAIEQWLQTEKNVDPRHTVLGWGAALGESPRASIYAIKFLFFLGGSWLLFFLSIPLPTAFVLITAGWKQWPYPALLSIDVLLSVAFLCATGAVLQERASWLGPLFSLRTGRH